MNWDSETAPWAGSPMKKVLYLTPSVRLLGARRSLLSLVSNLDPERWQPVVCGQSHGDLSDALATEEIPFEVLKLGWWRKGKYFLWRPFAIARLAAMIRTHDIDLVHCNEIYPNPYAVRAAQQAGREMGKRIPVVTHMRLTITPRMIRNYDLRQADIIVVPSEMAGRDFDVWPDKAERVKVIHNGVDLSEFHRARTQAEARRTIGVPAEGPLVGVVGQLGPRKGGDVVLSAAARLVERRPDVRFMFIGNPHRGQEDFAEALRERAAQPDLAGRVSFFPFTRDVLPYYEALDLNLLVSREEGFGRTIIEAAAVGTPTIGSRVGGIPELIVDEKTGLLVERDDDAALAEAMERLLREPEMLKAMGERAFRHVAQNFSIRSHAESVMALYDSLLGAPSL